jgi:hypothetical protein
MAMYVVKEEFIPKTEVEFMDEVERLARLPGNVKGEVLRTTYAYIEMREGVEAVKKVEDIIKKVGHPLPYASIHPHKWYPESYSVSIYLATFLVLGWKQEDIFEMAKSAMKISFLLRLIVKQFISIRQIFEESPNYWDRHLDFGRLVPFEMSEDKKYVIFHIEGYNFHPVSNLYHAGYFSAIMKLSSKSDNIQVNVTKSVYDGDPYTELYCEWD